LGLIEEIKRRFLKKARKNFCPGAKGVSNSVVLRSKSFLLLFFKKVALSFFPGSFLA